jgi:hypothetical protein
LELTAIISLHLHLFLNRTNRFSKPSTYLLI